MRGTGAKTGWRLFRSFCYSPFYILFVSYTYVLIPILKRLSGDNRISDQIIYDNRKIAERTSYCLRGG